MLDEENIEKINKLQGFQAILCGYGIKPEIAATLSPKWPISYEYTIKILLTIGISPGEDLIQLADKLWAKNPMNSERNKWQI